MKNFARLYRALDQTSRTSEKVALLGAYFQSASPADAAWALYFLCGEKRSRLVTTKQLRMWGAEAAGIDPWLFDECYDVVGDLAETVSLVLPPGTSNDQTSLRDWVVERLEPMRGMPESEQREVLAGYWRTLDRESSFLLNKLLTGALRVGVSERLVVQALAKTSGLSAEVIAHRLMGSWEPTPDFFQTLLDPDTRSSDASRPYPFYLASPLELCDDADQEHGMFAALGDLREWLVEWKWDGIRAQLIARGGNLYLWSRGEELITDRFPEIRDAAQKLPDGTVLDGEILPIQGNRILPFTELQRRIGRKQVGRKLLAEVPAVFIAFDLLEWGCRDVRDQPLAHRRTLLEQGIESLAHASLIQGPRIRISAALGGETWEEIIRLRETAREHHAEGLMLKRASSAYRVGRVRGEWWKWKIEPYTVDAVLIYAQRGHGRRASLYSDYTFALWDGDQLVPFAKAYSGLTDEEIRRVDAFVRRNTKERFGPVRSVHPELVFELAFENLQASSRHKSGIAVRFPRIHRWRHDLAPRDADSLEAIRAMLGAKP